MREYALFIGGEFVKTPSDAGVIPVINPADQSILGMLPIASKEQIDKAINKAHQSFKSWKHTDPVVRGKILKEAAHLISARRDEIAKTITLEVGKSLRESLVEVDVAAATLEWFAEEGRRAYGRIIPSLGNQSKFHVVKEPIGVVASMAPWNFPTINAARKIGAALAAGCTCIHKPAEEAPDSAMAVAAALHDAGLPADVLAVVFGNPAEISQVFTDSTKISKISFTGSIPVGQSLMKACASSGKRTTMELGGHAPVIVCKDIDIDRVVKLAVQAKYRNSGQVCVSPTRFLVEAPIYEEFLAKFVELTRQIKVGNGLDADTVMGPLAHERRMHAIETLVQRSVGEGAVLATGGKKIQGQGYFYEPTVLAQAPTHCFAMCEEPFGPVAIINPFENIEDAIVEANRLNVGLAAFGFSESYKTLDYLAKNIEAGMLALNSFNLSIPESPFFGIKESGHGAENGIEGLDACMVTKVVTYA